jgi:hypothetical protein
MADNLSVDLIVSDDKAEVKISGINQKLETTADKATKASNKVESFSDSLKRLNTEVVSGGAQASVFGDKYSRAFSDIEARAEKTRKAFAAISQQRIDKGQFDLLTQNAIVADKKIYDLLTRLRSLKKESSDPANATYFKQYQNSIRETEAELIRLERMQSQIARQPSGGAFSQSSASGAGENSKIPKLRGYGFLFREFAPTGVNETAVNAATTAAEIAGVGTATLAVFSAVAIAGLAVVKISQNIREEAERHLKAEEMIQGAINNQILSQSKALADFKKLRAEASEDRQFNRELPTASLDELKNRKATLDKLLTLTPATLSDKPNEDFEKLKKQILVIEAQIEQIPLDRQKRANDSFSQRWEGFRKSQQDSIEFEKKVQKERNEETEKAKQKVKELQKQYESVFDTITAKSNKDNPFVLLLTEADKSMRALRENTRGLSEDLRSAFEKMEQSQNRLKLFETRLNNNLDVFDLRERANSFRNPKSDGLVEKKQFDEIVKANIGRGNFLQYGGTYGSSLANQAGGFDKLTDEQKRSIYETSLLGQVSGNNQLSLITALANQRLAGSNQNQSLDERLQKQLSIIYGGASSNDEKAIADRKLVALTSGLNPNEISRDLREKIAVANENEAVRRESSEKESLRIQKETLQTQKQIADNGKRLLELAEKGGTSAIKSVVEIVDKTNGIVNVLGAAPTQADVQRTYLDESNQ